MYFLCAIAHQYEAMSVGWCVDRSVTHFSTIYACFIPIKAALAVRKKVVNVNGERARGKEGEKEREREIEKERKRERKREKERRGERMVDSWHRVERECVVEMLSLSVSCLHIHFLVVK